MREHIISRLHRGLRAGEGFDALWQRGLASFNFAPRNSIDTLRKQTGSNTKNKRRNSENPTEARFQFHGRSGLNRPISIGSSALCEFTITALAGPTSTSLYLICSCGFNENSWSFLT